MGLCVCGVPFDFSKASSVWVQGSVCPEFITEAGPKHSEIKLTAQFAQPSLLKVPKIGITLHYENTTNTTGQTKIVFTIGISLLADGNYLVAM